MAVRDLVIRILGQDDSAPGFDSAGSNAKKFAKVAATGALAVGAAGLAAGKALYDIGGQFDDAYDKIRAGTGKTGDALASLQDDFRGVVAKVPASFEDASSAITSLNQKLGVTGAPLQSLAGQFLELSRVTDTDVTANLAAGTDALNNFGVAAGEQPAALDKVFRASQASGVAFSDLSGSLAENGTQLRAVGLDFGQSTALIASLGQAGVSTSDVMPSLSKAMAVAAKQGKGAGEVFGDTFARIKAAPTDTDAAAAAMEVFGAKAGPKFAAMVREGKLSYEEMLGTVNGGGDTIMAAGADTADFAEKWQVFKNQVLLKLEPIATRVFAGMATAMTWLGDVGAPKVQQIVDAVRTFIASFSDGEGKTSQSMTNIRDSITKLVEFSRTSFESFKQIFDSVVTIVTGVWNAFGETLVRSLTNAFTNIVTVLQGVFQVIQGVLDVFVGIFTGNWSLAWDGVKAIFSGVWDIIRGVLDQALNLMQTAVSVFVTAVGQVLQVGWDAVAALFRATWDGIVGFFAGIPDRISAIASGMWRGVTAGVDTAKTYIATRFDELVTTVTGMPARITTAAAGMWGGITDAFKAAINVIIDLWNGLDFTIGGGSYDPLGDFGPSVSVPSFTFDLPTIPRLAQGGIVKARPGGTLALLAEAGHDEMVVPLDGRHGGGMTIVNHITMNGMPSPYDVSREIAWAMKMSGR